jgi:signal transduction histidine kinase
VPATVDRTRIVQLLDNLIGNARKYSAAGTPITVSVWLEGDEARLAVRDAGIGIAPEDLPRLFERFYRGSNVGDRRHDGMGLGLYICRGIAEQHGGRIWAEPIPDRGTVFHVALPAAGANVAASEPPSPEPVPEAGADASPAITPATSAP